MEYKPSPFIQKLGPILVYIEIGGLVLAVVGFFMFQSQIDNAQPLVQLGLSAAAGANFLFGFMLPPPLAAPLPGEEEPKGFIALLPTVLRKLLYIANAVGLIGAMFLLLHLTGAQQMLMIACVSLVVGILVSIFLISKSSFATTLLKGPLMRSVPIALYVLYALYRLQAFTV